MSSFWYLAISNSIIVYIGLLCFLCEDCKEYMIRVRSKAFES